MRIKRENNICYAKQLPGCGNAVIIEGYPLHAPLACKNTKKKKNTYRERKKRQKTPE